MTSFHVVDGVEAAVAKAQELAGDRIVEVAARDVDGHVLAAGLVDEGRMDVVSVVFGSGKRYFGSVHAQRLLEDPVSGLTACDDTLNCEELANQPSTRRATTQRGPPRVGRPLL